MNAYNQETITLNNGTQIPVIGFGTYQIPQNLAANAVIATLTVLPPTIIRKPLAAELKKAESTGKISLLQVKCG